MQQASRSGYNRTDLYSVLQVKTRFSSANERIKLCLQFNENDYNRLLSLYHLEGPLKDSKGAPGFLQKRL